MTTNHNQKGLIVAELINKTTRKTKHHETFYVLELNLISANSKEPFYVFASGGKGNKYAYTLETGCLYAFWFTKSSNSETKEDYFHVKDWRKLSSDKRSVERTLRLVLNRKEEAEEEIITNRELLTDLQKRIKAGQISLKISATNNSNRNPPLEIDTDLKDNDSNFRINLQEE